MPVPPPVIDLAVLTALPAEMNCVGVSVTPVIVKLPDVNVVLVLVVNAPAKVVVAALYAVPVNGLFSFWVIAPAVENVSPFPLLSVTVAFCKFKR